MQMKKLWLFIGIPFIAGFIWGMTVKDILIETESGYFVGKERPIEKPNTVTVDIIKDVDEILIYEYYSGELVFEYSKSKDVDKSACEEYGDIW